MIPSRHSPCISQMLCKGTKKMGVLQILQLKIVLFLHPFCPIIANSSRVRVGEPWREGDGRDNRSPSRASNALYIGLWRVWREEGRVKSKNSFFLWIRNPYHSITLSYYPITLGSDAPTFIYSSSHQSVSFGLWVRAFRTASPSRRTKLFYYSLLLQSLIT